MNNEHTYTVNNAADLEALCLDHSKYKKITINFGHNINVQVDTNIPSCDNNEDTYTYIYINNKSNYCKFKNYYTDNKYVCADMSILRQVSGFSYYSTRGVSFGRQYNKVTRITLFTY